MNGEPRNFWRQRQGLLSGAAGLVLLAGCAHLPGAGPLSETAPATPSPLAAEIAREAAEPGPYPRFEDIPQIPTDVRTPAEWRSTVNEVEGARETLLAETAPETFTLNDTDAFAARTAREADVRPGDVPTDAEIAASEAFARSMRERATPPPRPR